MTTRSARRLAISLLVLYLAAEVVGLTLQFTTGRPEDGTLGFPGKVAGGIVFLAWAVAGSVVATRRPRNPIGWLLAGIALGWAIQDLTWGYAWFALTDHPPALRAGALAAVTYNAVFFPTELLIVLLFLLFPDGHAPSPRWRMVGWVATVTAAVLFVGPYLSEDRVDRFPFRSPLGIIPSSPVSEVIGWTLVVLLFACVVAAVGALVLRFRRSRGDERQQLKWFAYAAAFLPVAFAFAFFGPSGTDWIGMAFFVVAIVGIPVAAAFAILKYRLYDIDVVISKTVIVGLLAAFVTIVYVGIVIGIGTLVGSGSGRPSVVLAVLATAVVALVFQPMRVRARRLANHLVYGDRAEPYDVLSDFSERLAGSFATDDLLPRMARMLAGATGASRADVWLRIGEVLRPAGSWPSDAPTLGPVAAPDDLMPEIAGIDLAVPVRHQGELLGAVSIAKKPGDPTTPIEERLVSDLAAQAGLVLSNVRLIQELRASRQRLVSAQDEERRKLERNLHDGAQQQLVALAVKERLVQGLFDPDPERARAMITEIQQETDEALETLRELARGIYPPLLADKGLAVALEAQARKALVPTSVEADGTGRYPQDVEAAVYFSCLEAMQNIAKYAAATSAAIRLSQADGYLQFEVQDDGRGFDPNRTGYGTGLQGMEDRLDAIGGTLEITSSLGAGTVVRGRIGLLSGGV